MSREQERIRKKLENNPIVECNKIQNRLFLGLFSQFGSVKDPRHQSYIDYSSRIMLGTMYYKCIAGISSMQEMTRAFNNETISRNLYRFMGEDARDYLPHGVTENDFLERLEPEELENIQQNIVYSMIRRKTFDEAKIFKKWQVIVDASELDEGLQKKNDYYLSRRYNKGEEKETEFVWITSIEITKSNAKKIVRAGRNRWKIENHGFNRQKHWQGNIEHACSFNERAQKNHYLMEQIADFMKQLYEYFYLEKNGIKKLQKIYLLNC